MAAFWNALNVLQRVYFCIGLAATVILVLQIILMLFGIGNDGEVEFDFNGDGDPDFTVDTADGFSFFTFRGLIAFFAIGGWVGYILADVNTALAIVISFVAGTAALICMGFIMRAIMKMRSDGNIDKSKAIGKTAEVYLTIPPKGNGYGKITLTLEERFVEYNAIQDGNTPIITGAKVKITKCDGDSLTVEKLP